MICAVREFIANYAITSVILIFVQLVSKLREGKNKGKFDVSKNRITAQGSSDNVSHTINQDERREFTRHMNSVLAGDRDIGHRLPLPLDTMQIFDECKDGLLLSKLINDSVPDVSF